MRRFSWVALLPNVVASINLHHIGVIVHMNTKMILAALALSLSLAACAKKEEAAAPAAEPAPAAEAPAAEAPAAEAPADAAAPIKERPGMAAQRSRKVEQDRTPTIGVP